MTNVAIVCVRQSSSRLPGKALAIIEGRTVLQHLVERYRACRRIDKVLVATSSDDSDAIIERVCRAISVPCHRGSLDNVVRRMDGVLARHAPDATTVFRGVGDMPLFDVPLLDWRLDLLARRRADLLWCGLPDDPWPVYGSRESPWSRKAWDAIVKYSTGSELVHPGQWLYANLAHFRVEYTEGLADEYYRPYRFELDTETDLHFFREVFKALYSGPGTPATIDVLRWLDAHPDVASINLAVPTKTLTQVAWEKRRGSVWRCEECGAFPLRTDVVRTVYKDGKKSRRLKTQCQRCGKVRNFYESQEFAEGINDRA